MTFVQVAIPTPLYRVFDYRHSGTAPVSRGARVSVPFGRRQLVGVVLGVIDKTEVPQNKLRNITQVHDDEGLLPEDVMNLLCWAADYYQHPLGEVLGQAIPALLRKGGDASIAEREFFSWVVGSAAQQPYGFRKTRQRA